MTTLTVIKSGGRVLSTAPRYLLLILIQVLTINNTYAENGGAAHWAQDGSTSSFCIVGPTTSSQQTACDNRGAGTSFNIISSTPTSDTSCDFTIDQGGGNTTTLGLSVTWCGYICPPQQSNGFLTFVLTPGETCPTTCPANTVFNSSTGNCDPLPTCTSGLQYQITAPTSWVGGTECVNGCEGGFTTSGMFEGCIGPSCNNDPWSIGTFTENGNSCTTDSYNGSTPQDVQEQTDYLDEVADTPFPNNGCITNSSGTTLCLDDVQDTPPLPDTGTAGVAATPDGTATNTSTNQTVNTFNSTTTNNSTTNNFSGSTGAQPNSDGNSNPTFGDIDTTGDGNGDCDPSTEDCGTSSVSGGATCDVRPQCDGDPIFCAIRFQAWSTRCNLESNVTDITETDVMDQLGQTQTIEEYFDPANNSENEIDVMSETTLPTPTTGSCPPDLDMSLSIGSLTFPSQPICDIAAIVRPAIIAIAYLISGLMFYNGLVRDF